MTADNENTGNCYLSVVCQIVAFPLSLLFLSLNNSHGLQHLQTCDPTNFKEKPANSGEGHRKVEIILMENGPKALG